MFPSGIDENDRAIQGGFDAGLCRSTDKKEEAHKQELSGIFHLILISHGRSLINVSGLTFKVYGEDVFVSVVPHHWKELKLQSGREIPVVRTIRRTCTVPQGVKRSVSRGTGGPEYGRFISRYLGLALRMPRRRVARPQTSGTGDSAAKGDGTRAIGI